MGKQTTILKLFVAGIIILMLNSMHAWFLWNTYLVILDFFVAFIGFIYISESHANIKLTSKNALIFFLFCLSTLWNSIEGIEWLSSFHPAFLLLLTLGQKEYRYLLHMWTNTYAIILSVSLIAWLGITYGSIPLPAIGTISFNNDIQYTFTNYFFCLVRNNLSLRFNSIFLEPGHVGMIAAFTLAANRFNFKKWQTISILVCSLFTLSLAGYILIIIGLISNYILKRQSIFQFVIGISVFGVLLMIIHNAAVSYNKGNNLYNELIVERLEYDEDYYIVGNNRFTESTDMLFERYISSSQLVTGMPEAEYKRNIRNQTIKGAGYKLFLMQKGIIGLLLILSVYILMLKKYRDKRMGALLLMIYSLAFLQRAYPLWESWIYIFLFASALDTLNSKSEQQRKKLIV